MTRAGYMAVAALSALLSQPARAQNEVETRIGEPPERLFGLTIESIVINAPPAEDRDELLALSGLVVGRPYVGSEIRRAVKLLYQLDRFENIYVSAARHGNAVSLELTCPPRPRAREIIVEGAEAIDAADVEEAIGLHTGSELDNRTFAARREKLIAAYRRIGYRSPAIGIATTQVDLDGQHDLTVVIDEGPRTHLRAVVIEGTPRRPLWVLKNSVGIEEGYILNLDRVTNALQELAADYRKRGYLEISIGEPQVREIPGMVVDGEPYADLIIRIEAGPLIDVRFSGHQVVSLRELEAAASVLRTAEIGATPAALTEVVERILSRYERRGYWQARVHPLIRTSSDGSHKEILFAIDEGPSSYVASINFVRPDRKPNAPVPGPALDDELLREKVIEVVEDTLSEELGKPGADPQLVAEALGERTLRAPRASRQPDTSSPDARRVYVPRAYKAAGAAIGDLYRSEGYQTVVVEDPKINIRKTTLLDITFEIKEGVRWEVGALAFSGNESITSTELIELAQLDPQRPGGLPLSFYNVEEARRAMLSHYQNEGYLYARVEESLREVPERGSLAASDFVTTSSTAPLRLREICARAEERGEPSCSVELVFRIVEGPQVKTKNIVLRGVESTSESLVRSELAVKEGEILRESDMVATKTNLLRIGVFERVSVRPLDEKSEAAEKDVICEVRERKHSSFEVGAGASSAEGVRAFAGYGHDNLLGTALRFQANAKVSVQPFLILYDEVQRPPIERFYDQFDAFGRIERELAVGLSYPRIFGLPRGFGGGLDLSLLHDLNPQYAQDSLTATVRFDYKGFRPVLRQKQRPISLQLRSKFDLSELVCPDEQVGEVEDLDQLCAANSRGATSGTAIYLGLGPLVSFDLRDDALSPTSGAYVELDAEINKGLADTSTDFLRVEGTINAYLPLANGVGLAFSLFAGEIFPLETGAIPINLRFFAGGSKTVRGYAEQTLHPQDRPATDSQPISSGGLLVAALKNELRFPISGAIAGAIFYDLGDLWEEPANFHIGSDLRQSVGVGIRYATPVGPLSLDVGVPLVSRDPGEGGPTLHFSVRSF